MAAMNAASGGSLSPETFNLLKSLDEIRSECDRLNELRELLNIAQDYCCWGNEAALIQNFRRVCLLIECFNLSAEDSLAILHGHLVSLEAVIGGVETTMTTE